MVIHKGMLLMLFICLLRVGNYCNWSYVHLRELQEERSRFLGKSGVETFAENSHLTALREKIADNFKASLPSPHSELLSGMVLGYDELYQEPTFKENLKKAGLVHVVVVSGFNISLVFNLSFKFLGSKFNSRNLVLGLFLCSAYATLCGFEPPVFRALIMGSTASIASFYGRRVAALRVLFFSVMVMVLVDPLVLYSISFQLSLAATFGLVFFGSLIQEKVGQLGLKGFVKEDLATTLSAQIFVAPLLLYYFKSLSLISVVVNSLILWTVPIITVAGFIFVPISFLPREFALPIALFLYPYLDIFVRATDFFSTMPFTITVVALKVGHLLIIYAVILALAFRLKPGYTSSNFDGKHS